MVSQAERIAANLKKEPPMYLGISEAADEKGLTPNRRKSFRRKVPDERI